MEVYNRMIAEQNSAPISSKYNLFSPNDAIGPCKSASASKKPKMEIKLVFHHPNLLFLNSHKYRTKEETAKYTTQTLFQKKHNTRHTKTTALLRPRTSEQTHHHRTILSRSSAINTPWVRRSHTEEGLSVCGKSSCLTNELIRNPAPTHSHSNTRKFSNLKSNDETLFKKLEGKAGQEQKEAWSELLAEQGNRHAVRLDMYFSVQKKYLKYVSRCG